MAYKVEFLPDAEKDFEALDGSIKREVAKKIEGRGHP
jgi:mRNA-degrading endonuclease RelE of RelBE toxin-antitoxin system